MEKGLFAPRVGVTFRATPTMVLRGGFGITNDPYSLARPMRTNHPILLNLIGPGAEPLLVGRARLADGVPPIPDPDLGNGIIPIPSNVTAFTLPDEFNRGYIKSWNAAVQKELKWGFVGEAAYVGDAADRPARVPGAELVADRRRSGRPAAEPAVRTHGADAARGAGRRHQVRRAAGAARSALRERLPDRRRLHAVEVDRDRRRAATATARRAS